MFKQNPWDKGYYRNIWFFKKNIKNERTFQVDY